MSGFMEISQWAEYLQVNTHKQIKRRHGDLVEHISMLKIGKQAEEYFAFRNRFKMISSF
jgi:hypothetical protein